MNSPLDRVRGLFLFFVVVLATVLALPSSSWADSCKTTLPSFCKLDEGTPELQLTLGLTGLSFTASAQGAVVIYDNVAHTLISDVVVFTDVAGVATVTFVSDLEGPLTLPPGTPILGKFTEGSPISLSLALTNGKFVNVKICSDVTETEGCNGSSDSIRLKETSAVPEPGSLALVGSGLIGSGIWGRSRYRLWRLFRGTEA